MDLGSQVEQGVPGSTLPWARLEPRTRKDLQELQWAERCVMGNRLSDLVPALNVFFHIFDVNDILQVCCSVRLPASLLGQLSEDR